MNMENIKLFNWGNTTSLLLAALFIICLDGVVGKKHSISAISSNVEKDKPLVERTTQMTTVVEAPVPTKVIPLKIHESPSQPPPEHIFTPAGENHSQSAHTSSQPTPQPTSNVSQSSPKDPHPSPPSSSDNLLKPKKPHQKGHSIITIHPYTHATGNQKFKSNSTRRPHTWKGRKMSNPILTDNQLINSTQLADKAVHPVSTPSPNSNVSKLKSMPLSQPQTSQISKVSSLSPLLNDNQVANLTESRSKTGHHPSTHSPVSHNSKLKSAPSSRPQTSEVNKMPSPVPKAAQFFNSTNKPGNRPYHPSPTSRNSKLKLAPPSRAKTLQVSKVSSPVLTVNELEVGDKAAPNPSTDSHGSELKSTSVSQQKTSHVSNLSSPRPVLADNQLNNSTQSGSKVASRPSSQSQISRNSKLKSVPTRRPHTSKLSKGSRPALKDNQFVNLTESGHKRFHHPSTPSPVFHNYNVKSASPPGPQTLVASTAPTPILTDNQFVNSTDKSANYPSTPSPEYNVSKLESVPSSQSTITQDSKVPSPLLKDTHHAYNSSPASHVSKIKSTSQSRTQTSQVNEMPSPVSKTAQFFNSTNKPGHRAYHPSHNSKSNSTLQAQPQTSQVSKVPSPILTVNELINSTEVRDKATPNPSTPSPESQDSESKSISLSQPQTSQVSNASTPAMTDNQSLNSTVPRNQPGHQHTSSPVSHNSNSKSAPPAPQQTLQIRKVSSTSSTDNQFANLTKSGDKSVNYPHLPSQVSQNSKLKPAPPSQTQTLQLNNVSNPVLTDEQLDVNSRVSRNQPGHHPSNSTSVHQNSKLKTAHPSRQQSSQISKVSSPVLTDNQFSNSAPSRNQSSHHHPYNASPVPQNSNLKSGRTPTLQVSKVSSPVLTDNQLVNSTKTLYKPGHHPSTASPLLYNSKLKPVPPSPPQTSHVNSVSSSTTPPVFHIAKLKTAQPHSFQVHKVTSPAPAVTDIKFVTSTESGDKAAHFKVTFR